MLNKNKLNLLTKISLKIVIFLMGFWSFLGYVDAATIESKTIGGNWSDSSTWIGGIVPSEEDDVVISGPVLFKGDIIINGDLLINSGLGMICKYNGPSSSSLTIYGDTINNGYFGGCKGLYQRHTTFNIKGKLVNNGEISEINTINIYNDFVNNGIIQFSKIYLVASSPIDYYDDYYYPIHYKKYYIYLSNLGIINLGDYSYSYNLSSRYFTSDFSWKIIGENDNGLFDVSNLNCFNNCEQQPIQIPIPTNLKQYIQSPYIEKREEIQVGSKIGKFQSGSGVIFELELDNPESKELKIKIELYEKLSGNTRVLNSDFLNVTGKRTFTIPLEAGDYTWKLRLEDTQGNTSDWKEFGNNGIDIDFSIFEGFEPYPYGFNFENGTPNNGMLTGGISGFEVGNYDLRFKISGRKWNIFYKAFDTSEIENDKRKLFDMFESLGLNNDITLFDNGSCFGLSTLALLKYQDDYFKSKNIPNYLEQNHNRLYTKIKNGNIYDLISNPSSTLNQNWNTYSDDLEDIFAFHLSGNSKNNIDLNDAGVPRNFIGKLIFNPNKILETLKNNPDKKYILNFEWEKNGKKYGHSVIPYRVDGNRIYIYDNVVKFPFIDTEKYGILKSYEQYIEIQDNGKIIIKSWPEINENDFTLIGLMDIEEMNNNGKKSIPKGFNDTDTLYILRGNSDLLITDINGNKTGYKNGEIYDEIQGTRVLVNYSGDSTDDTWKQIYLPQKLENLTIEINGKTDENYDLMIAGGDYYTKLEGITTSLGQTDVFNISRENIKIDLDDIKTSTGTYNILVDDFQNNGTGSIYLHQLETIKEKQELNIDWNKVINNIDNSISYFIDTNNDGTYDIESTFNSLPKSENETGSISGRVISSPSNAGYKVCLDINNNGKCEENIEPFIVTDNTGNYKFDNLNKGSYNIIQEPRNNWEIIKPLDKKYTIKLNNGQNIVNLNFENSKINGNKNNNK
ncbi:hypothetical protein HUU51_03975 [Candidatus Gracilibacteria bacterium]|nr:hypothetical protein [Candidatus Gracilibacteria bacterium]